MKAIESLRCGEILLHHLQHQRKNPTIHIFHEVLMLSGWRILPVVDTFSDFGRDRSRETEEQTDREKDKKFQGGVQNDPQTHKL